jgi:putative peptide maturation system protein
MSTSKNSACITTAAEHMLSLSQDNAPPQSARARTRELNRSLDGASLRLLWEQERVTGRYYYTGLLDFEQGGVLSLGYVADAVTPFPLRRAHKWQDNYLLRVNGRVITVQMAMACLDLLWQQVSVRDQLIHRALIQEAIDAHGIEVSNQDLQQAMDAWRIRHGLLKSADTHAYLTRIGLSPDKLEDILRDEVAGAKLRQQVVDEQVDHAFRTSPHQYCQAVVSWIATARNNAQELCPADAAAFFQLAQKEARQQRLYNAEFFLHGFCGDFPHPVNDVVFDVSSVDAGQIVVCEHEDLVYRVLLHERLEPELNKATRHKIQQDLFSRWLSARRTEAVVEWFWGDAETTEL